MHIAAESSRVCDNSEVSSEPIQVARTERRGERIFVRLGDRAQHGKDFFTLRSEVQGVSSPVACAGTSFDETATFDPVQDGDNTTRTDTQVLTRVPLPDTRLASDQAEQPGLRRRDAKRRDGTLERSGGIRAQL